MSCKCDHFGYNLFVYFFVYRELSEHNYVYYSRLDLNPKQIFDQEKKRTLKDHHV